ncbi:hypothetical protein ABEB36_014605 [Hypothenemus hampei]|uniref:Nuclease HARBI1 n=1 Tax=Hypothenemus hampei TaxID=57062 RepID=A0ABD1E508_HYPHA
MKIILIIKIICLCFGVFYCVKMENEEFIDFLDFQECRLLRISKRYIRDLSDPFQIYNELEFKSRFRFSKRTVRDVLCPIIQEVLQKNCNKGLPFLPIQQLLVTLRFYATENFQLVSGDLFGMSQPTVSLVIKRVSEIFAEKVKDFIKFPEDSAENILKFYTFRNFPNVSACIDGTHIPIKNPGGEIGEIFRNRKRIFSINVQGRRTGFGHYTICGHFVLYFDILRK